MTRLNAEARDTLQAAEWSQAAWIRHHFGDTAKTWRGDACGCPDDRCIGYHHDTEDDCQCLTALLAVLAPEGTEDEDLAEADSQPTSSCPCADDPYYGCDGWCIGA